MPGCPYARSLVRPQGDVARQRHFWALPDPARRRASATARGLQVTSEERVDLLPGVGRLLRAVAVAVGGEEGVSGAVVAVELVGLAQALQLFLGAVDLLRRRVL